MEQSNKEKYYIAEWLEGKISDQEFKDLVGAGEFKEYQKLKQSFEVLKYFNSPLEDSFQQIKAKINRQPKSKVRNLYYKWSVGVAAILILLVGLFQFFQSSETIYKTGNAQQLNLVLVDGSKVILGPNSILKYNPKKWKAKRALFLEGKAFFKVQKGQKFTVKTEAGEVSVLGTQFDVIARAELFKVTCYEGKVKVVTAQKKKYILTPQMTVQVINGKEQQTTTEKSEPDWISGRITFEKVPLKIVVAELEHQYGIKVEGLENDEILFTGSFPNDNLQVALASVFKPLHISYKVVNDKVILSEKN